MSCMIRGDPCQKVHPIAGVDRNMDGIGHEVGFRRDPALGREHRGALELVEQSGADSMVDAGSPDGLDINLHLDLEACLVLQIWKRN